jgi:hypothetical protein
MAFLRSLNGRSYVAQNWFKTRWVDRAVLASRLRAVIRTSAWPSVVKAGVVVNGSISLDPLDHEVIDLNRNPLLKIVDSDQQSTTTFSVDNRSFQTTQYARLYANF